MVAIHPVPVIIERLLHGKTVPEPCFNMAGFRYFFSISLEEDINESYLLWTQ